MNRNADASEFGVFGKSRFELCKAGG